MSLFQSDDLNAVTNKTLLSDPQTGKYNGILNKRLEPVGFNGVDTNAVPSTIGDYDMNSGGAGSITLGGTVIDNNGKVIDGQFTGQLKKGNFPSKLTGAGTVANSVERGKAGPISKVGNNPIVRGSNTPKDLEAGEGVGGKALFMIAPVNNVYGKGVEIEMMPARRSFTPQQGQSVPGAGAGLEIRVKSNIAKLPIPGSRPIWQHMGIAEETISFVGAFCGFDLPDGEAETQTGRDAYEEATRVIEAIRDGYELELTMSWEIGPDLLYEHAGGLKFRGYVRNFVKEFATAQKVYYRIEMVITNRDIARHNDNADAKGLNPGNIKGGLFGLADAVAQAARTGVASTSQNDTQPKRSIGHGSRFNLGSSQLQPSGQEIAEQAQATAEAKTKIKKQQAKVTAQVNSALLNPIGRVTLTPKTDFAPALTVNIFSDTQGQAYVINPANTKTKMQLTYSPDGGGSLKTSTGKPGFVVDWNPQTERADIKDRTGTKVLEKNVPLTRAEWFAKNPALEAQYKKLQKGGANNGN